ncbi:MAG: O-antigen ligase family protein [Candidatus Scalinduaceae bacterium]
MFRDKDHKHTLKEKGLSSYYDQIIISILLVIIIAVPLFFDIHLYSVFDLSKITVLYILAFAILIIWSIKTITISWKHNKQLGNRKHDIVDVCNDRYTGIFGYDCSQFIQSHPLNLPIITFLLVSGLATLFSLSPYTSLVGTYKRYDGFISTLVYIFLFYAIVNFIERRRLNSLINIIILTVCIASIYGIFQHFGLDLYRWNTTFSFGSGLGHRVSSTFGHPAFFSAFLIMVIPLVLIKIFSCKDRIKTCVYITILAFLTVTFYYTKTRATFLGLIISNVFFFSLIGRKTFIANRTKTIVALTVLVGISLFYNISDKTSATRRLIKDLKPALLDNKTSEDTNIHYKHPAEQEYLFSQTELEESDVGFTRRLEGTMFQRVFQYITGLKIIYDYPILGIGPETLGMIYPQYLSKVYKEMNEYRYFENQNRIHNDFLDMTVSKGLLGLGVYAWFIFAYSRMIWKGLRETEGFEKILIIGFCSSILGYFIQNQFSFGHVPIITLFWFLIGMSVIACHSRNPLSNQARNEPTNPPRPQTNRQILKKWSSNHSLERLVYTIIHGLIICLLILFITLNLFRYKADVYFSNGLKLLNNDSIIEAIRSYEMAVKHNPLEANYRDVLNGIYLKMAVTNLNKKSDITAEESPVSFSREQAVMWLTKTIIGANEVQKLFPMDYRSAFTLGQAYHVLNNISDKDMSKDAIRYYKRAITLHPFKFELRDKLAQLYFEKGQLQESIQELKEAIRIAPANPKPYINLANIFTKLGRNEEARRSYNRILELTGPRNDKPKEYARNMLEHLSKTLSTETTNSLNEVKGKIK